MTRTAVVLLCLLALAQGCLSPPQRRDASFGVEGLRVSPTFTRTADGVLEADVELLDAFGDSVKGGGLVTLRLFAYEPRAPLVQGREVGDAAQFDLSTVAAQRRLWQPVSRTYLLRVERREVRGDTPYLLVASYEAEPGPDGRSGRMFDRVVVRPRPVP